jgi:AcrR family transcriptional regulator
MPRKRSRSDAEARFINAVHQLLLEEGFQAVGINSVAERAGLNKVLIYRYFGGLEDLLSAYAERMDPFPRIVAKVEKSITEAGMNDPMRIGAEILRCMIEELRSNPQLQELLKWELADNDPLSGRIAEARERSGGELQRLFARYVPADSALDWSAVTALLTGGVCYLYLRSSTAAVFNGIRINTRTGQERLIQAAEAIVGALLKISN